MKTWNRQDIINLLVLILGIPGTIAALIAIWIWFKPEPKECFSTIRVLDKETGDGIDSAEVKLDRKSFSDTKYTDSQGKYTFEEIPCSGKNPRALLTVKANKYEPNPYSREIRLSEEIEEVIRLTPTNRTDGTSNIPISPTVTATPSSTQGSSPQLTSSGESPQIGGNLVKNPGFEEGLSNWQRVGEIEWIEGKDSPKAVCSIQTSSPNQPFSWKSIRQENIEVEAGKKYWFGTQLLWKNPTTYIHAAVDWYDKSGKPSRDESGQNIRPQPFDGGIGDSNGWLSRGGEIRAPKDAVQATINIIHGMDKEGKNAPSKFCIDDVVFAPISTSNLSSRTKDAVINDGGWWAEYYRGDFETQVASGEVLDPTQRGRKLYWIANNRTVPPELQGELDNFSIRFFAKRDLARGQYLFTVTADDRSRVKVNDNDKEKEIISAWYQGSFTQPPAKFQSSGGVYDIVVDYKNDIGAAEILLDWKQIAN